MTERYDPFEQPDLGDYTELVQDEVAQRGGIDSYLAALHLEYTKTTAGNHLEALANLVDPVDRTLGRDAEHQAGITFYKGGLLGLRVAKELLGRNFSDKIVSSSLRLADTDGVDALTARHQLAVSITDLAEAGYSQAATYHAMLEELEDEISPDIRYQRFLKRGFGIIMYQTEALLAADAKQRHQADLAAFEEEVAGAEDIDWDGAFREQLG